MNAREAAHGSVQRSAIAVCSVPMGPSHAHQSRLLPFRNATEHMLFKGTYIVGFGTGSFVSDLDCKVTSPAAISIIADWNGGDQIRIEGLVKDVTMGSVDLDQCHLSK